MTCEISEDVLVDGHVKSTRDTNGRLIAQDTSGQISFWRFYGNGPVDDLGRPIVVYHGACGFDGDEFSYDVKGVNSYSDSDIGFFFGSAEVANCFAIEEDNEAALIPAYLSIQNPKFVQGATFVTMLETLGFEGWANFKSKAVRSGHDGVIVRTDEVARNSEFHHQFQSDNYIAFYPEQIKSAIGNPGTYNRNCASMTDGHGVEFTLRKAFDESDIRDIVSLDSTKRRFRP